MVENFDIVRIGDVASVRSGFAFKSSDWTDSGVPVVKIGNVKDGNLVMDGCSFVSPSIADSVGECNLHETDILIAMTGYIGEVAMVRGRDLPALVNQRVGRFSIRDASRLNKQFLFYSLRHADVREQIEGLGYGSAQPNISPSLVASVDIPLPPLPEQLAIAHILGTLDDKIELNRRMNETLEDMARAIFQDWFVNFGPVRAKVEGRDPYLPPDLWALFPDRLVDSESGEIPEGWQWKPFGAALNDVIGGDWGKESPDSSNTEPVSIIRGTDLPNLVDCNVGSVPLRYTTKTKAQRRALRDGDIIVEVSGGSSTQPTGRSMMVTQDILTRFPRTVVCASFCRRLRPRSWPEALLAAQHLTFLNSTGKMWDYQLQSTGLSNFQTKRFLEEEHIVYPTTLLLSQFTKHIGPIVRYITRNDSMLVEQRDALLPKLMSGDMRVIVSDNSTLDAKQ